MWRDVMRAEVQRFAKALREREEFQAFRFSAIGGDADRDKDDG